MYQIANLNPKEFSKIRIRNQAKILELTGSKFDPLKAYEIIKNATKDFTQANEKAKQADELYTELLKLNGIISKDAPANKLLSIREQERARNLKLLELELQLASE